MKKRDDVLTFLQVVCAFSVITLHTNSCFWKFSPDAGYWFLANIIECVFYFAVPIFFMISGITLIDYQEKYSTAVFFKKRITKALVPYLVWSCIGLFYRLYTGSLAIDSIGGVRGLLNKVLEGGGIVGIYWFFPSLFCVYLAIPLFAAVDKNKREKTFKYVIFIGLVFNTLIPFVNNIFNLQIKWPYIISIASGYILWAIIGYVMYRYPMKKGIKAVICFAGISGLFMHICGTYILSMSDGFINRAFKEYNNLPCLLYSCGAFIVLYFLESKIMKYRIIGKVISFIGKYTFPIYLMHWFVIDILTRNLGIDTTSILWRLGAPIPIGLLVVLIAWLIRKIPVVRGIVP